MPGIFTRKAQDEEGYRRQLAIGRRPARPIPKVKEKRLINGKWTRDYGESISDKMRAVAARLRRKKA